VPLQLQQFFVDKCLKIIKMLTHVRIGTKLNLYEALDSRKNTVEKKVLSDNRKIAGLKLKFG
jgi:hypothetical protein